MKTDYDLQRDILEELRWEPSVKSQDIGVAVHDGVVTLTGNVPTYAEKFAAEDAAKRVPGVRAIAEELIVNLFGAHVRNDSDIAQATTNALDWNVTVPNGKVKTMVENGWITLSGDVEWNFQRDAARDSVRHLMGVKGVTNLMHVIQPSVSTSEVRGNIESALKRSMQENADNITIEAHHGKVTLRGKVDSWEAYNDAGRAAWSAPGVSTVENDLVLTN